MSPPVARFLEDGSIEHYAVLFTPTPERAAAAAVLGFARAMRELVGVQRDVAPNKIHWWHEELARFERGEARHPLCAPLTLACGTALTEALNALLHGAVMDVNEVDVGPAQFDDYLYRRAGAVHAALAAAAGVAAPDDLAARSTVCGVADLLREARDPAFARLPVAHLDGVATGEGNEAIETHLVTLWEAADTALARSGGGTVTGAILLGLYKTWWPAIMATPYGQPPRPLGPWRKLWTAWRAARAFEAKGKPS